MENRRPMYFCIDVETTGLNHRVHELIQICIVPADESFNPIKEDTFYFQVQAEHPHVVDQDALTINKLDPTKGLERIQSLKFFKSWLSNIKRKYSLEDKLIPIGQNYSFDKEFIINWLNNYEFYHDNFSNSYRDTKCIASSIQDFCISDFRSSLAEQAKYFGITNDHHHDAYNDCIVTLQILKEQSRFFIPKAVAERTEPCGAS